MSQSSDHSGLLRFARDDKIVIDRLDNIYIARDDLLPGGTKRRALTRWLPQLNAGHFHYTGSVYGSGGWALAEACKELGLSHTLHLSQSEYHPAWVNDVNIIWHRPRPVEHIYNSLQGEDGLLPLGYDHPDFKEHLVNIMKDINVQPSEIWMPCVSGTLLRAARLAWPDIPINAVCVAKHHGDLGNAKKYQAPEKYHQPAQNPPPYPANVFSDAKLWPFVRQFALKDALIWNTSI